MDEKPINHALHIVLAILTGGLWLIPYLFILLAQSGRRGQERETRAAVEQAVELGLLDHQTAVELGLLGKPG